MALEVREAVRSDADDWTRMRHALWPEEDFAEMSADVEAFFDGSNGPGLQTVAVFVAQVGGETVGFLELSVREYAEGCIGPTPYVEGWFVEADHRGSGVGRSLMDTAEQWAIAHGYDTLASDASSENEASLKAHGALGFQVTERIVVFAKRLN